MTREARTGIKAWLITWEWCGRHAAVADKIAAVLPSRRSEKNVADMLQFLYLLAMSSFSGLAHYAKRPSAVPYTPTTMQMINGVPHGGRITCGSNPYLYGRPVTDLTVAAENEYEVVEWTEPPTFRWKDDRRMGIEVAMDGRRARVQRSLRGPLRSELVWDHAMDAPRRGYEGCDFGT